MERTYQDANSQWFQDKYPGAVMDPDAGVLHTTETTGWPPYDGGATAPNVTARPNFTTKTLEFRTHYPLDRSSRSLKNLAGGVETNTADVVQVELVGTCSAQIHLKWQRQGYQHVYWPEAPDWAIRDLGKFLAFCKREHGIPVTSPIRGVWTRYPDSYGAKAAQRLGFAQWRDLEGWVGHQHVPENDHGDPGALDFPAVSRAAVLALGVALRTVGMKRLRRAMWGKGKAPIYVRRVQAALHRRGFLQDGYRKGNWGAATTQAAKDFQRSIGHPATGHLTRPETARLGRNHYRVA